MSDFRVARFSRPRWDLIGPVLDSIGALVCGSGFWIVLRSGGIESSTS